MKKTTYQFEIGNTYGNLRVVNSGNGTYTLELDDFSSTTKQHIKKELFEMLINELTIHTEFEGNE